MSFENPKTFVYQQKQENICLVLLLIITLAKQNCRLVPLVRNRVGRNGLKLEKCYANFFQVLAFLFPKCARTDQEMFLSRIELISFLSLF